MAAKIYTKTGDNGMTALFGGQRVLKSSLRVNTYGTIDELNAYFGLILSKVSTQELKNDFTKLNNLMFIAGSDVATPLDKENKMQIDRINSEDIILLEEKIDKYTGEMPILKNFILGGGTEVAALINISRTICRRVERLLVELNSKENLGKNIIKFFNRLSDYLFTAARYVNFISGVEETPWKGR